MIVIINPPFVNYKSTHFQEYDKEGKYPNPALTIFAGLFYEKNIPYLCIDAKLDNLTYNDVLKIMQSKLDKSVPKFIGITNSNTTLIDYDFEMVRLLRKTYPAIPIVMGGPHVSALPERTLQDCKELDIVCMFVGVETILKLYDFFSTKSRKKTLEDIPGIAFRDDNGVIKVNPSYTGKIIDMQSLGRPRWEEFSKAERYFVFTVMGCPFRCSYCFNTTKFKSYVKPINTVIEELNVLINWHNIKSFTFADATFGTNKQSTKNLLQRMIDEGIAEKVSWDCCTRVDVIDQELVYLMKQAGCFLISLGIESGSDRILKRANKKTSTDQIARAVKIVKGSGIRCHGFFILGHIGESLEDIEETIKLIVELNLDSIGVGLMTPWPGTEVYELALKGDEGLELTTDNFQKFDKYFGEAMINKNIKLKKLESLRNKAYLRLYLQNKRYIEFLKFIWAMRRPIFRKVLSSFGT